MTFFLNVAILKFASIWAINQKHIKIQMTYNLKKIINFKEGMVQL